MAFAKKVVRLFWVAVALAFAVPLLALAIVAYDGANPEGDRVALDPTHPEFGHYVNRWLTIVEVRENGSVVLRPEDGADEQVVARPGEYHVSDHVGQ